ncbi:MAG: FlgD immunoglobulin-like domain containing protein [bacterium]|nr:FlgD immunoglobulin-like domain containing protein [bacterium]
MNKLKLIILTLITAVSILFLVSPSLAAPNAPTGFTAVNFGGPIRLAWTASTGGVGTVTYTIYRVEADSTTIPTNPPVGAGTYGAYAQTVTFGITSTNYIDTSVSDGTTYYYFVTGNDGTGESSPATTVSSATSDYPEADSGYYLSLAATETTINYETSTLANPSTGTVITYTISDVDQSGNRFVASKINYDIIDNFTEASIYKETQEISAGSGGINTGQITWDGRWFNTTQYTKHNGSYTVEVWATDFAGTDHPKVKLTITVHAVHVNDVVQTFTDFGTTTIAHSLPINFSYQLTQDAWTTITIYNTNGTVTTADDTLVKRFTYFSPRNSEGQDRNFREYQTWDGTDENIKLVPSGIYRFAIDAYFDHTGAADRDTAESQGWTFALDKRIVDITTTGITASNSLASIKYTLNETANVKIKICKSGTTFTTDATTGEAVPSPAANLVKTFTFFQQSSGEQEITWDGNDEGGVAMNKGVYFVVITATDAEGNKFFNTSGTDNLFRTTVSIDKTAIQIATDSTAPTVTSVTPANATILTSSFTQISAIIQDNTGGSGVDLVNSTITLTDPSGSIVSGTQTNNGSDTITLTIAAQETNGTYTMRITPRDLVGNVGSQATYTFSLNTSVEEQDFKESVFVYPNPIKGRNATFAYSLSGTATVTIEVYTVLGEKIWSKVIYDSGSGDKRVTWRGVNNDGEVLADELYLYKITAEYSNGNTRTATKKLIISK